MESNLQNITIFKHVKRNFYMFQHVSLNPVDRLPVELDKFYQVEATARIDFSGGWSDTPPITYEIGGAVVTGSLLVDGKVNISKNDFIL